MGGNDYAYDVNGNLISDYNKSILTNQSGDGIQYNYMDLVTLVNVNQKGTVKYVYDGTGNKLKKEVYDSASGQSTVTVFIGGLVYQNDTLLFVGHEEGRIRPKSTGFVFDYFIKDHLGECKTGSN